QTRIFRARSLFRHQFCQTKIENFGLTAFGNENVCRFNVAMDDSFGVSSFKRVGYLRRQFQQFVCLQWASAQALPQRLALKQLHDDERMTFGLVDIMDCANVGMIESRSGLRLTAESRKGSWILPQIRRQKLQRDRARYPGVLGFVDNTHAAATKPFHDTVVRNYFTDHASFSICRRTVTGSSNLPRFT